MIFKLPKYAIENLAVPYFIINLFRLIMLLMIFHS